MHEIRGWEPNHKIESLVCVIKKGLVATQSRFQAGVLIEGTSSESDLASGGGNYVFTHLINERLKDQFFLSERGVEVLIDLDATNLPSFGYREDTFGSRRSDDYKVRGNLVDTFDTEKNISRNEVMIKDRIPPKFFKGILVHSQEVKKQLVERFLKEGWVLKTTSDGAEYFDIDGKQLFIHLSYKLTKDMF